MSTLDRFFAEHFDKYLLADIETLMRRANALTPGEPGSCGYPLLMAVFGGIELLGAFTSASKFSHAPGKPLEYFRLYWENHLYKSAPRQQAGAGVYALTRHGVAHAFLVKGEIIEITKDPNPHSNHLTKSKSGIVTINSFLLAQDFLSSLSVFKAGYLASNRGQAETRLGEILDDNVLAVDRLVHNEKTQTNRLCFVSLPEPVAVSVSGGPVPASTSSFRR